MAKERRGKELPKGKPRGRGKHSSSTRSQRNIPHSHARSPTIHPEAELARMLVVLKPHDHLCLIYESREEWRAAAVPFIAVGLKRGEKCLYIADTSTADEIRKYLAEEGIDVASVEKSGQLSILYQSEAYTKEGSFDPDSMIALLVEETEKAIAEGYPALRVTGEMTWVLRGHPGSEKLLEYEAKLNRDFFPYHPCLAICQYDRWKFDSEVIKGVVMTHPLLVRGNHIYHNFYYVPPKEFLNQKRAEVEVQHWLNNLEREQQIQETLRQSEEKYRTLIEQSLMGLVVIQDFRIIFANASFAEISGYSIDELLSLPPEKVQALVHPEDQALVWGRFRDRLAGKAVLPRYECRTIRKDGTVSWMEVHANRIEYNGKPAIQAAYIDITDYKRAEEALRKSEDKYRKIFEEALDAIFIADAETGVLIDCNRAACELVGRERAELIGKHQRILHPAEQVEGQFSRTFREHLQAEEGTIVETQVITRKGEIKEVAIKANLLEFEGKKVLQGIFRDISERKQAEEALQRSQAQYQDLYDNAPVCYYSLGTDGWIKRANRAGLRFLGYSLKELQRMKFLDIYADESKAKSKQLFEKFTQGIGWENEEMVYQRKNGERVYGLLSVSPILDENGQVLESRSVVTDITDRMRAEEALKHLNLALRAIRNINQLIARRVSRDGLVKGACENLVKTRGYYNAWIALLDESGNLATAAEAGLGKDFSQVMEQLKSGYLPDCGRKALKKSGAAIIKDPSSACTACPLAKDYSGRDGMSIRLEYGGKVYGVMTVSISAGVAGQREEQELFEEVAGDIAFALHSMQQEGERRQAEQALRRSEERYRSVLEEMEEGYYEVDAAGNFTFVNNTMCHMLGYSRDELIGMNYKVYIPQEQGKAVFEAYNRVYRTGEPLKWFPMAEIRKDGTRIFVEDSVLPLRNDKGEVIGFRGVSRNVTERKEAEEALKQSEERYRQLTQNAGEAIFVIQDGVIKFMNPKGAELSGYSIEELAAMPFVKFIHPNDIDMVVDRYARRLKGEPIPQIYDFRIIRKDGDIRWGELNAVPISWEDQPAVLCFMSDITERKKAEEALRQSAERYRTILEEMEDSYFEVDLGGHLTFVNSSTCRHLGYCNEELIGMSYKGFTVEEDIESVLRVFGEVYRTGVPNKGFHWKIIRKDGAHGFVEATVSPLRHADGEIIGFSGVGRDITERKKIEEQLILTDRLASVGQLAAGIAHELNNPLTAVIGFSDLLLERDLPADVKEDLETVNREAKRAVNIVKGLLAFAREQKTEKSLVNINIIIQGVLQIRSYEQRVSNIEVDARFASALPMVVGNGVQLQQVFINIIVNAEQAMIEAHGRGKLTIVTQQVGDMVRASITDDGPGISPANMKLLFTPFFTTREVGKGTGLGLSICHGIVTEHGGKLHVESEPGKGATFVVELPISR